MDTKYCDILRELRKKHGFLQQDIADRLDELNVPTTKGYCTIAYPTSRSLPKISV